MLKYNHSSMKDANMCLNLNYKYTFIKFSHYKFIHAQNFEILIIEYLLHSSNYIINLAF